MDKTHIATFLRSTPLGKNLSSELILALVNASKVEDVSENQVLVKKGDVSTHVFVVIEGKLHVQIFTEKNSKRGSIVHSLTISKIERGSIFGDMLEENASILTWNCSVRVFERARILILDRKILNDLCQKTLDPQLLSNIAHISLVQLRIAQKRNDEVASSEVLDLIYRELYELAIPGVQSNNSRQPGRIIQLPTHQILSEIINSSRETVSTELKALINEGKIIRLGSRRRSPILITQSFFEELTAIFNAV